jgi:hypothetical protein
MGSRVLFLISFCTRPAEIRSPKDKILWLEAFRSSPVVSPAVMIKLADRVCNVLDYCAAGRKGYAARYAAQARAVYQRVWSWDGPEDDNFLGALPDPARSLDLMKEDCGRMRSLILDQTGLDIINASLEDVIQIQTDKEKKQDGKRALRPGQGTDGESRTGSPGRAGHTGRQDPRASGEADPGGGLRDGQGLGG